MAETNTDSIQVEVFSEGRSDPNYVTVHNGRIIAVTEGQGLEHLVGKQFSAIHGNQKYTIKLKGGQLTSKHLWGI